MGFLRILFRGGRPRPLTPEQRVKREEANRVLDREGKYFPFKCITKRGRPHVADLPKDLPISTFLRVELPPDRAVWGFKSWSERKAFTERFNRFVVK